MINGLTVVDKHGGNNNYNLTEDQQFAAGNIIDIIASPFDPKKYILGLTGPGGTGKTYTIDYIINKCKFAPSVIECATPTHKACRVLSDSIGGKAVKTIQSLFGFRLDMKLENFDPKKPQFNPMAATKLDNIRVLIIDESSMLPAKVTTYICNKCKELEIIVIFTGDPYQLAPVNERKSIAFDRCQALYHLRQIVRQGNTNPVGSLLQILRSDIENKTYKFLEYIGKRIGQSNYNELGEGFSILRPPEFTRTVNNSFSNEEYSKNIDMYRVIGYTNPCITVWNSYIRNNIIADANKNIITKNDLIMSYETIVNEFMESVLNNSEEYIIDDITNFIDETYKFKGFLVRFQLVHGGQKTTPLFIIDHRDRESLLMYHHVISSLIATGKSSDSGNRVNKWKEYYAFKKKYLLAANVTDALGKTLYTRDIDYGFSITAHKSQGSTYGNVFVDVNDIVYNKYGKPYAEQDDLLRRLYVACSRPKKELVLSFGR